jgi:hypothetical protein
MDGVVLQCCCANGSGAARISTWKSLSDVADRATPMHVARQHVLVAPQTLRAAKSVRFENKKATVLDLKFILEKC